MHSFSFITVKNARGTLGFHRTGLLVDTDDISRLFGALFENRINLVNCYCCVPVCQSFFNRICLCFSVARFGGIICTVCTMQTRNLRCLRLRLGLIGNSFSIARVVIDERIFPLETLVIECPRCLANVTFREYHLALVFRNFHLRSCVLCMDCSGEKYIRICIFSGNAF